MGGSHTAIQTGMMIDAMGYLARLATMQPYKYCSLFSRKSLKIL